MKRDMDLIRDLLLAIEENPDYNATDLFAFEGPSDFGLDQRTFEEVAYHLQMLVESGLIRGRPSNIAPIFGGLTMAGHDLLDSIRDPEIWKTTKEGAAKVGGFTLKLLGELASGLLKTQLERLTGVKL